ncbi:MAG: xanthine dehydrogenase family protein molybdopterin-binding subunit, partial [Proteobacteria bacterium]
ASSAGAATQEACLAIAEQLYKVAHKIPDTPFAKVKFDDVQFEDGAMVLTGEPAKRLKISKIMQLGQKDSIKEEGNTAPSMIKQLPYARNTHSAVFVEVEVDEDHGMVHVSRVVAAIAAGRILNPKTARSQILGGVVWGISMALHEESVVDHKLGRIMNHNFSEYHIPVNRDIENIEVIFVEEEDKVVSPIGVKGLGEIGIVGTAAAVANAIFHATGKRVRDLPITLDKLL